MAVEINQVLKAKKVLQLSGYSYLTEQLAEYFPHTDMSWLTDENDLAFEQAFSAEGNGWLTYQQDQQFWMLISEASDMQTSDAISAWLQTLLRDWAGRAEAPGVDEVEDDQAEGYVGEAESDVDSGPAQRFNDDEITPVGEDYPGWWQGYDHLEGVWMYIKNAEAPTGESKGWMASADAFPAMQSAGKPTEQSPPEAMLDAELAELVAGMMEASKQGRLAEYFGVSEEAEGDDEPAEEPEAAATLDAELVELVGQMMEAAKNGALAEFFGISEEKLPGDPAEDVGQVEQS
jgi:hypothetical protein